MASKSKQEVPTLAQILAAVQEQVQNPRPVPVLTPIQVAERRVRAKATKVRLTTRLHERQHDLADCPGLPACNKTEWVDELSGQLAVLTAELVELEARS